MKRSALTLAVPAYFHPVDAPTTWRRLVKLAPTLRYVIVNPHNGPGEELDPTYVPVIEALKNAGIRTVGYVDTDYAQRDPAEIGKEARTYRERFGLDGVFMDQVSCELDQLDHYAQCVLATKTAGLPFVVLNPGAAPHPGYVDLANITVTFEGTWDEYQEFEVPEWLRRYPKKRFSHLVYAMPKDHFADALDLAVQRHAESVYVSDGTGDNPWGHLPSRLPAHLEKANERVAQ